MSEQPDNFTLELDKLPDILRLRDADGQFWAISVRSDGQLQTAQWPDGEPVTMAQRTGQAIRDASAALDDADLDVRGLLKKSFNLQVAQLLSVASE